MPIYAYRCTTCGHAQDVLRKISDPPLSVCPTCGAATFVKQVTAAGFQLKGSGWYVTDFRGDKKSAKTGEGDAAPASEGKVAEGAVLVDAKQIADPLVAEVELAGVLGPGDRHPGQPTDPSVQPHV